MRFIYGLICGILVSVVGLTRIIDGIAKIAEQFRDLR